PWRRSSSRTTAPSRWCDAMLAPGIEVVQARVADDAGDALRADIVGLAGIFARGPVLVPIRVEDWGEQRKVLGGVGAMPGTRKVAWGPLAAQGFFQNGGRTAIFFRVASLGMRAATATFIDPWSGAQVGLCASSPGAWGSSITVTIPLRVVRRVESPSPF